MDARYEVEAQLGEGAMGVVYRAREIMLDRRVALKKISGAWAEDESFSQQFHLEARAIARIRHPNVVQLYTFGIHDGAWFLAMELVEGTSLADVIRLHEERQARISPHNAVMLLSQVFDGVAAIHAAGLVHCDLKPSNIVVEHDTGRPVIVDFGVAVEARRDLGRPLGGSPGYMAPEQGETPTPHAQTDIYALGCTAYELLTGQLPYVADSLGALLREHRTAPIPRLSSVRPELEAFDAVIERALAKSARHRFATCAEMRDALNRAHRRWSEHLSSPARGRPRAQPDTSCVLVVDDDPGFRRAVARAVRLVFPGKSLTVLTASSGEQALSLAVRRLPRLVLLDYMLPKLDGVATLSVIRSLPGGHDVRVVVISGAVEEVRWQFVALGVRHFLDKPVDFDELAAMVDTLAKS